MLKEQYALKPIDPEFATLQVTLAARQVLEPAYAWTTAAESPYPIASLISPIAEDDRALDRFRDNASLNHHDVDRFLKQPVTEADVLPVLQKTEIPPVGWQLLGAYLIQVSRQDPILVPFMDALTHLKVDAIGVFVAMASPTMTSVLPTLVEQVARLLARWLPDLPELDHLPTDAETWLPAYALIPVESTQLGISTMVPVALLDWLSGHQEALAELKGDKRVGLMQLLNQETDDDTQIVREWLLRRDDDGQTLSRLLFEL